MFDPIVVAVFFVFCFVVVGMVIIGKFKSNHIVDNRVSMVLIFDPRI